MGLLIGGLGVTWTPFWGQGGPKVSKMTAWRVIWSLGGGVLGPLGLHFGVHGGPKVSKMRARGAIGALNGGVLGPLGPQGRKSGP